MLNLVEEFLKNKQIKRGVTQRTIEAYRMDLLQFLKGLPTDSQLDSIQPEHLHRFLTELQRREQGAATRARKTSTLRQFFQFCCAEKRLKENPAEAILSPVQSKRVPQFLSMIEVQALLERTEKGLPYPRNKIQGEALRARDRALLSLLLFNPIQVSELLRLTPQNINLEMNSFTLEGKGDQKRFYPLHSSTHHWLKTYLETPRDHLRPRSGHLFVNHRGTPLTRQAIWKILKKLAAEAQLTEPVSLRVLKQSLAYE